MNANIFFLSVIILMSFSQTLSSQNKDTICNCKVMFEYVKEKIKINYMDYSFKIKGKKKEFDELTAEIDRNLTSIDNLVDTPSSSGRCFQYLSQWVSFFNDLHLFIVPNYTLLEKLGKNNENVRESFFAYHEKVKIPPSDFYSILKNSKDPLEGFWILKDHYYGDQIYGIIKDSMKYIGFQLKQSATWKPGMARFIIDHKPKKNKETKTWFLKNNHLSMITQHHQINDTLFSIDRVGYFIRKKIENENEYKSIINKKAEISPYTYQAIDSSSEKIEHLILKFPSFSNRKIADSLITLWTPMINKANHLIIDIRGNMGGGIDSFEKLMPFIYTQPIKLDDGYIFSSPGLLKAYKLEIEEMLKSNPNIANSKSSIRFNYIWGVEAVKQMEKYPNKWITYSKDSLIVLNNVEPLPKKVSVICDETSASAAELFLLRAKQSSKVKIFGQPSHGGIKLIALTLLPDSPCSLFRLYVPGAKVGRWVSNPKTPERLQPDVVIPYQESDWIKYVINF
jgi:hypothetical protein